MAQQRFEVCIKDPQGNAVDVQLEVRPPLLPCGCPRCGSQVVVSKRHRRVCCQRIHWTGLRNGR
jgi:hypothetical protein